MAQIAGDARVRARQRELGGGMIEHAVLPLNDVVALGAAGGESSKFVIRIRRIIEVGDVTRRAIRGSSRKLSARMALHTGHVGMGARQGEPRGVVVECGALPLSGSVANRAILRVPGLQMVGTAGRLIILDMAAVAIGGRRRERSAAGMAGDALQRGVSAGQRELGGVVIKCRALPVGGRMTGVALGGKIRQRMIGIGGVLEIGEMTAPAGRGRTRELIVGVAGGTLQGDVCAGQRKRRGVVIKRRALPAHKAMAKQAIVRKTRGDVVGTLGGVEVVDMAAIAIHRRSGVAAAHVALRALERGVRTYQREVREGRMIEFCALPAVEAMAARAVCRQIGSQVRRRRRLLIVGQVAAHALGTQPVENAHRRLAMAGVARNRRVRAKQREPIEVVLHVVHPNAPPPHGVAILARGAELAAMNVGMTIRALLADLREDFADVALAASYVLVHGSQRILRLGIMIEFRFGTDRLPAHRGMAAFAWDREWAVRVLWWLNRLRAAQRRAPEEHQGHPCTLNQLLCRHHLVLEDTLDYHD